MNLMGDAWISPTTCNRQANWMRDLRSNIAAEARAKIVYERLIDHTDDPGSRLYALQFLMTREITRRPYSQRRWCHGEKTVRNWHAEVTPGIVDEYFNGSTGQGSEGDTDVRGPWTSALGLHLVEPNLEAPGGGLSEHSRKIGGEDRGKQDDAPKATTSPGDEKISSKNGSKARKPAKRWQAVAERRELQADLNECRIWAGPRICPYLCLDLVTAGLNR